jgi:EipB-like
MDHSVTAVARALTLGACALWLSAAAAPAATMAPHRAYYELDLAKSSQKARLESVVGRLAYELTGGACDGWNQSYRIVNRFRYREGVTRLIDLQSVTWEAGDGKELRFNQKEFVDRKLTEEKRVSVRRATVSSAGTGEIQAPAEKTFALQSGALFPMHHQQKLVEAAINGRNSDKTTIFNGSENEHTVDVLTTIGRKATPSAAVQAEGQAAALLKAMASWPVNMGYYPSNEPQAEIPAFQVSFDMYENGVTTNLLLDYGDVVLRGRLVELELLQPSPCD